MADEKVTDLADATLPLTGSELAYLVQGGYDVKITVANLNNYIKALTSGQVWVGNSSNVAQARTLSGDFTISNTGEGAIAAGAIVNADVNASAAIALSKLATQAGLSVVCRNAATTGVPQAVAITKGTLFGCNSGGTALGAITLDGPTMSGTVLSAIGGTVGVTDSRIPVSSGTGGKTLQASGVGIDTSNNIGTIQTITQQIANAQVDTPSEILTIKNITGGHEVLHDAVKTVTTSVQLANPNWVFPNCVFSIRYFVTMISTGTPDQEFYTEGVVTGHVTTKGIHVVSNQDTIVNRDNIGSGASVSFAADVKGASILMTLMSNESKSTNYWWLRFETTYIQKT